MVTGSEGSLRTGQSVEGVELSYEDPVVPARGVTCLASYHPFHHAGQLQGIEQEATDWLLTELDQANTQVAGEVYLDGLSNVLAEPEFIGSETAHRAMRVLEERSRLQDLLSRTLATSASGGVQVLIGGEGTLDELRPFSLVLARYGTPGLITGTLGVVGPMRMPYGRAISTIRFLAGLLSSLVSDTLVD